MSKIVAFWLLGVLSLLILGGGGAAWLFFWVFGKAKKNKMF